jgi:hypothetical protein
MKYICLTKQNTVDVVFINTQPELVKCFVYHSKDKIARILNEIPAEKHHTPETFNKDIVMYKIQHIYPEMGICKDSFNNYAIFDGINIQDYEQYLLFPLDSLKMLRETKKGMTWTYLA